MESNNSKHSKDFDLLELPPVYRLSSLHDFNLSELSPIYRLSSLHHWDYKSYLPLMDYLANSN